MQVLDFIFSFIITDHNNIKKESSWTRWVEFIFKYGKQF